MIYEKMTASEIKKQETEFANLNKFISKYKKYIKCSKRDLMNNIPEKMQDIINNRTYYMDDVLYNELAKYKDFAYIMDNRKDDRSRLYMIYYICTTVIYENVIAEILKNFNCEISKTGTSFMFDFSKASGRPDFTILHNNKSYEIEVQRCNFMLKGYNLEIKYHKIGKNILNYVIDENYELKVLLVKIEKGGKRENTFYSNYLPISHKKGFILSDININSFVSINELLDKKYDFDEVLEKIYIK